MRILVYLKEIPPEEERDQYQDTEGLNDSDKNVLMEALNLRDEEGGTVTVMTIGPSRAEKTAREALTWGVDRSILVLQGRNGTGNVRKSARLLARAIEAEGAFDIVLCGRQALDGDAAHMAAMTAFFLKIPLIAYSRRIEAANGKLYNWCMSENGTEQTECSMPALVLSVKENQKIRHPNVADIMSAYAESTAIPVFGTGQSETERMIQKVREYTPKETPKKRKLLDGKDEQELAEKLYQVLREQHVLE